MKYHTKEFDFSISNFVSLFVIQRKLSLAGVGVRVKTIGPVKANVYSTAMYIDKAGILAKLKQLKSADPKTLLGNKDFQEVVRLI